MQITQKLRDDMMCLYGSLTAICFPLNWSTNESTNHAYYDLIDNIREQYVSILKRLYSDFDDD